MTEPNEAPAPLPPPGTRTRSSPYPRDGLREAEQLARTVFRLGPRHVGQETLARDLGYTGVSNGAYRRLRASANYFGLIDFTGDDWISVPDPWIKVLHEEDATAEAAARVRAVKQPSLYQLLFSEYQGRMLPSVDRLARELYVNPSYGIMKEAAPAAAQVFFDSILYAGLIDERGFLKDDRETTSESAGERTEESAPAVRPADDRTTARTDLGQDVDRLEVRLRDGRKVYVLIPSPGTLTPEDKQRVKGYIDLVIEKDVM